MNTVLLLLSSIAQVIAGAISDPKIVGSAALSQWAGYLTLATRLASLGASAASALSTLNDQLVNAVSQNRGLTPDELAQWKARDDIATDKLQAYLDAHATPASPAKQPVVTVVEPK